MATGTYTGNGTAGRTITGLGFRPDVVILKVDFCDPAVNPSCPPDSATSGVMRTSTMTGDNSKPLVGGQAFASNLIQSLDADGFTVGSDLRVNALDLCGAAGTSPCDYYWTAWKADADIITGTYTGNGVSTGDPQSITGLGFAPDYIVTMCACAKRALHRTSSQSFAPTISQRFSPGGDVLDGITSLDADGFTVVKSSNAQDDQNESGQTHHYVAWNAVGRKTRVGEYTGNGVDSRPITGVGFQPEYVIVQRYNDETDTFQRSDRMVGDASSTFRRELNANRIQALLADGFELGIHGGVNEVAGGCTTGVSPPDCHYFYVAFNAYPATNYRSIGTAPDYSTGMVTATQGSPVVLGTGGTMWKTENRGRGDAITISGSNYTVYSVESETKLRLTTAFTGGTGSYPYTLARQYKTAPTLAAWEDCIDGGPCTFFPVASPSLVADKRREVGIAYKDTPFALTANVVIDGSITDATHTITLTADGANRHYGVPGAGVIVDANLDPNGPNFRVRDSNVTVEWLELSRRRCAVAGCRNTGLIEVNNGTGTPPTNILLQNLLVHDFYEPTLVCLTTCPPDPTSRVDLYGINLGGNSSKSVTVRNSMIWDGDRDGIRGDKVGDTLVIENCSIDQMSDTAGGGGRGAYADATLSVTVRNTIATSNLGGDFHPGTGSLTGGNNTSSDLTAPGASPQTLVAAIDLFVAPNSNLHLKSGAVAVDTGVTLSSFSYDIDGGGRPFGAFWDRGADELGATTEVELSSFNARGGDGAVELEWETASELKNLGFHLYRATLEEGPYERITASAIPGLGSSPAGARYRYRDFGLTNGITYFYKLEDIETTGKTELHGPVSATPQAGAASPSTEETPGQEAGSSALITYGEPRANSFRVLERGASHVVLELITEGFYLEPRADGTARLSVPGFEPMSHPSAPSIPVKRSWVDAVAGLKVEISSLRAQSVESLVGLRLSRADVVDVVASREGTVGLRRASRAGAKASRLEGFFPEKQARLLGVGFQGDVKKTQVELAPLRWDDSEGRLLWTRRLLVRLSFRGRDRTEVSPDGLRGRLYRRRPSHTTRGVVARLVTRENGLYSVGYGEIFQGSRGLGVPVSALRLSRQGKSVLFHIEPAGDSFAPGSRLYFVGEGADANPYGREAVYELERSGGGDPMEVASASPSGEETGYYREHLKLEEQRFYQAGLLDAPDLWLWDVLFAPVTKSYPFELEGVVANGEGARLSVWLQGVSDFGADPDHHLRVYVNGSFWAEASWNGKKPQRVEGELGAGVLREGENLVEIENVGDTGAAYSMVMLDRIELDYPRQIFARAGGLRGRWSQSGVATLQGVGSLARVLDVTDKQEPRWLSGAETTADGAVRFRAEAGRSYLAVSEEAVLRPEVRRPKSASWKRVRAGADYLVIGPQAFLTEAEPLLELRRGQGLRVKAVAVEDLYEEFGFGESRPEALREFLQYAYHRWPQPTLRYVLLLGDATYDFKDYLGTGVVNRVPALLVKTSYLWTASDPTLAAVNGDDILPDLAIGRLPAADAEELRAMVAKILAFEASETLDSAPVALVTDNPDAAGDFVANAEEIAAGVLAGRDVRKLHLTELGTSAMRESIVETFDSGASLVSYIGHGGIHLWADENLFDAGGVASLAPQPKQPLLLTVNCLNGYFHFPYFNSLAEEILKAPAKGAVAAFSPSGLSLNAPAHQFHKLLLEEIFNQPHRRLGDAVLAAQAAYAATGSLPELLTIYHLFGDPAMRIR